MKCHAGVEFPSGQPCPKCHAKLGEVCWPGINADLVEVVQLRKENERLRSAISFWRMARYPETRPGPFDMEGRAQVQAALDLAENTLYELSKAPPSPIGGEQP